MLATIGAVKLAETAFELETASRDLKLDYCAERFPEFKEKLLSLHERLTVVFPKVETVRNKAPGDIEDWREIIHKVLAAAEDFDNDACVEMIRRLLPYDFGDRINLLLEQALTAFEDYEFSAAAECLKKIETTRKG
jgi:predicted secreted protein